MTPHQILKDNFGFEEFRLGQLEIITSILEMKNTLAVMPTGAGKSLCYQIPALLQNKFSIVISPLISLMQDQVEAINKNGNYAAFINSSLDYSQVQKVLNNINENKIKLLYLAPEKIKNAEFVLTIKNLAPYYLFVDEAHCISEWGHNFRPSYRNIKDFADTIGIKSISAFTATATPEVRKDIIAQLRFLNPSVFVYGFERENLAINVVHTKNKKEKIYDLLKDSKTSSIVYASTRKHCEQLTEYLKKKNIDAEYYHAGLTTELRKVIQDDFINDRTKIIVATNAFGMGIDKKDIGLVIHYNIPGSIENLYQEIGRAGRDGKEAKTYLFYSEKDKYIQEFLISLNNPTVESIKQTYNAILDYHRIAVNSKSESPLEIDDGLLKLLQSKSINTAQFDAILTYLEQSEYLAQGTSSQFGSHFKFLISQEQLKGYVKKVKYTDLQEFLLTLIQYYGAIPFERKVKINFSELSALMERSKTRLEELFIQLNEIGIIDFEKPSFNSKIVMLQERVLSDNLNLNTKEINSKKEHSKDKLDSVIEYCFTDECRFKYILNYFGENKSTYKCNKCDNCTIGQSDFTNTNEYLAEIIIRTFKEFHGGLTLARVIGILSGKSNSQTAKSISTYQSCMHYNSDTIEYNVRTLVSKKVLKEIGAKLFLDPIEELIDSEITDSIENKNYENNLELYNKLREERNLAAKKFSQQADIICSENILRNIAKIKPTSPSELLSIEGFNQRMFNKIGSEFLEVVREYSIERKVQKNISGLPKHISQTYKLIKKGYNLQEISNLLKLSDSIISVQLESIISYFPNDDYSNLILKEEFEQIEKEVIKVGDNLKEIKNSLPTTISYAKIRIVKALLSSLH
ncbi:MAG: RecQ family ATP-dependent DNA helicase [Melioribacteraceae bacterium]|nr:RecQ family ATP-dependent DNA helicase [Melioribacteraceae bacterium]